MNGARPLGRTCEHPKKEAKSLARMVALGRISFEEVHALIAITPQQFLELAGAIGRGNALAVVQSRQRVWLHFQVEFTRWTQSQQVRKKITVGGWWTAPGWSDE